MTRCSWSGWRRAGRPDEPERLQPSPRGFDGERRRSAGLLDDRTHSQSNGCPGRGRFGSLTPSRCFVNLRLRMDIQQYLEHKRQDVDRFLDSIMPAEDARPATLHKAMRYSLFAGGQRVPPLLAIAGWEALCRAPPLTLALA